jgi:hypothetical protein
MRKFTSWVLVLVALMSPAGLDAAPEMSLLGVSGASAARQPESCPGDPGGANVASRLAGTAGRGLYPALARLIAARNRDRPERPLGTREKDALRPVFGVHCFSVVV